MITLSIDDINRSDLTPPIPSHHFIFNHSLLSICQSSDYLLDFFSDYPEIAFTIHIQCLKDFLTIQFQQEKSLNLLIITGMEQVGIAGSSS